jgi:hypothetical protein
MNPSRLQFNSSPHATPSLPATRASVGSFTGEGGHRSPAPKDEASEENGDVGNQSRRRFRAACTVVRRTLRRYLRPWRVGRVRDQLRERLGGLAEHGAALRRHGTEVEQAFMTVGAALHEQTRLAAELVEQGRRFNSLTAATAEANPVRAAMALITETVTELEALQQESSGLVEQLRRQHEEIAQLRHNGAQLERAIAPLRIVDTLFRIESAGLPIEMQAAFSALTQEIARLDLRVRETFLRHFEALGTTREAIGAVLDHFSAQRAEQGRVAQEQNAAMRSSLAMLEGEITWLRNRDERTGELLEQIDRETNGIVVALQYQDITRQKLEHVLAALAGMSARLETKTGRSALAFAEYASKLEACQLAAIDEELERAADSIDLGLRQVVGRLQQLERDCLEASDCGAVAGRVDHTVTSLLGMLEQLRGPMVRAVANAEAAARAVQSFGGLTADLGETIRELTWGIRLIALNAQVQAAQVERCDGLEVLARHTYVVSEETSRYGDTLGRDLSVLHDRLGQVVIRAESFTRKTEAVREKLESNTARVAAELSAQRAAALEGLRRFGPLFRQTHDHARRLLAGAALANLDRDPLRRAEADLRDIAAWCAERSGGDGSQQASDPEFAALQQDYTMATERAIHHAVMNSGRPEEGAAGASAAPTTTPVPMAALLDQNVELF